MGRFVSPQAKKNNVWYKVSENLPGYLSYKTFADYVDYLCYEHLKKQYGVITGDLEVYHKEDGVRCVIRFYDKEIVDGFEVCRGQYSKILIREALGVQLLQVKRAITLEGSKYFGTNVEVVFIGVTFKGMTAEMLSRYVAFCLEQGYGLKEIYRVMEKKLRGYFLRRKRLKSGSLVHRSIDNRRGKKIFRPYKLGDNILLGFRVDCAGRYSKRQRASKKSISVGRVPMGNYEGFLDYGASSAVLDYGVSTVRVWLYFRNELRTRGYLFKVK